MAFQSAEYGAALGSAVWTISSDPTQSLLSAPEALALSVFIHDQAATADIAFGLAMGKLLSFSRTLVAHGVSVKWDTALGAMVPHWCTQVQRPFTSSDFDDVQGAFGLCGRSHCTVDPASMSIFAVAFFGNLPLVEYLVYHVGFAKVIHSALHGAASGGHLEIVQFLIQKRGVPVDITDHASRSAFAFAVRAGQVDMCTLLLKQGADPSYRSRKGRTALHLAAKNGRVELLRKLLALHILDVDIEDTCHTRPLHEAAMHNHLDCLKLLVHFGARVDNYDGRGSTILHVASYKNYAEIVEWLLTEMHMDPHTPSHKQVMPLHFSAMNGAVDAAKTLVRNGADPLRACPSGMRAFDYCRRFQEPEGAKELLEFLLTFEAEFTGDENDGDDEPSE